LTIELGFPWEFPIILFVILVGPDMRKDAREQQIAAVNHDILEYIRVAALSWDPVWG
jgi:hypothetical protein